jgi:phosphosulfolactate synthase (CoM biosynthesis protein A)
MTQSHLHPSERALPFVRINERQSKPRAHGVTEIRGPYYTPMGKHYLQDILETMGAYVDTLKFAGGSFALMPYHTVVELISLCHDHNVLVSTGGFIEHVLPQGAEVVDRYIQTCRELGFDIIEISSGFITAPTDDLLAPAVPAPSPSWRLRGRATRRGRLPRQSAFWTPGPP